MAKQSSVQITCKVDGDGVDARFEPPAQVNAAAPDAGPHPITLIAGAGNNALAPPADATGLLILPAATPVADLFLGYTLSPAGSVQLDPTRASYIAILAGTTVVYLDSTLGGDVLVQWT